MAYFRELREQWRPLTAAMIGLASGFSTTNYVASIMAPHLLKEFGWTKAEFASISGLSLISMIAFPFVGRLTDLIGARLTALTGILALAGSYLALTMMTGDIRAYIVIFLVQASLCITTTATVYSRPVVQHITQARGLALAVAASGPAIFGVIGAPLLNNFVEAHGWRMGYYVTCAYCLAAGFTALLLMPAERKGAEARAARPRSAREDYAEIFRNRAFWILIVAMLLCNVAQIVALTQLNLVMLDNGVSPGGVSVMISAFAVGVLVGRFVSGVALDRMSPNLVSAVCMALPAIGLFLIASSWNTVPVLMVAVWLIGFSFGAESDLIGYLVVRAFGVRVFSSVMGMMVAATAVSVASGAVILGIMLKATGGFAPFLTMSGVCVLVGSVLFLFLPNAGNEEVAERG